MHIHLLRRSGGFIIRHFGRNPQYNDEGDDPAGDVYGGVGLVQRGVVRVPGGRRRGRLGFDPVGSVVVGTDSLIESLGFDRTAEAQETAPAAVPVVGVVAGELFVVLTAHVVVAEAGVVIPDDGRLDLSDPSRCHRRSRGAVDLLHFRGSLWSGLAPLGRGRAQDAQRVQIDQEKQEMSDPHGFW